MKIVILNLVFGTIVLMARIDDLGPGQLSRRLAALRSWPFHRNRQPVH
jgi:hypothetical protein